MCAPVSRLRPHCRGLPSAPQRRSAAAGGGAHFSLEGLFALSYPRPLQPLPRFLGSGLGKRQAFSDSNPSLRYVRTKISWSSGLYSFYTFSKIRVEFFIGINCFLGRNIVKAVGGAGYPFDFKKIMGSSLVVVDGS